MFHVMRVDYRAGRLWVQSLTWQKYTIGFNHLFTKDHAPLRLLGTVDSVGHEVCQIGFILFFG